MTNSDCGLSKEYALRTYRAMVEPIFGYGVPLFMPIISKTWIDKIQIEQNQTLGMVTGCHAAASEAHLHHECKLLPVKRLLDLLATQFLANAMQTHHPSHSIVTAPPVPRAHLKPTLQTKYDSALTPYLTNSVILSSNYKKVVSALHTSAVQAAIANQPVNRVLGTAPPDISEKEIQIPREHQTTLSQLCSDFCKRL
jgi:hypothetical protein